LPIEMWLSILSHVPRRVIDGVLSSSSSSSMKCLPSPQEPLSLE
jgi:hypothetical protein